MRGLLRLLLWFTLIYDLHAHNLRRIRAPQGPLRIALDFSLASTWPTQADPNSNNEERAFAWSSHLTFGQDVSTITDGQLWQLALDAHAEMNVDRIQYEIGPKHTPTAMAVLAWGKQLIIASSQKGPSFSYRFPGTQVLDSLRLCQVVWRDFGPTGSDDEHNHTGRCAEPAAVQLYYFSQTVDLQFQSARVGTVVTNRRGVTLPTDPCGDPAHDIWGCNLFVASENLRVINNNIPPEPYDLTTLAGGVGTINQIQMCSVIRRF